MSDSEKAQVIYDGLDTAAMQFVFRETRDFVRSLEGTATSRVEITAGAFHIVVERGGGVAVAMPPAAATATASGVSAAGAPPAVVPGLLPIVAPLVGVFYRSSSPGVKPFVDVGDTVEPGQTIGIVEAMKVMNEVTSDYRGVVKEILVENGQAVQFEQQLILIDTSGGA